MGVSIYVMPLTRYLIGAYRTTWGDEEPSDPPDRKRLELDAAQRYLDAIQAQVPVTFEDETRPGVTAVAMSVDSLGDVIAAASPDLAWVRALGDVFLWLPAAFDGLREFPDPFDTDSVISAGSTPGLHRELGLLEERLGRREEPQTDPNRGFTVRTLRALAAQAIEHAVPMIVEG